MRAALYFLIGVLLAIGAPFASAAAPQTMYQTGSAYGSIFFATKLAACEYVGSYIEANNQPSSIVWKRPITAGGSGNSSCYGVHKSNGSSWAFTTVSTVANRCLDGSLPDTTKPLAQQCADPAPVCEAGAVSRQSFYEGSGPLGSELPTTNRTIGFPKSDGTCNVEYDTLERCYGVPNDAGTAQDFYCDYAGKKTGTPTPAGSGDAAPSSPSLEKPRTPAEAAPFNPAQGQGCPKGTANIGTDSTGGSICAGSGTSPIAPTKTEVKQPTQTTTNPDGSTTQTEVTTRTNTDGSTTTTTKTTTTGADGKVTTTESSVTGDRPTGSGGGAGRDDSSDDATDFCKKNPHLNACKNSSVSGECGTTSCEGDAIQCAILRQQRIHQCKLDADETAVKQSASYSLGTSLLAGTDPLQEQIDAAKTGITKDLANEQFDQTSFAPSSCFGSKSIVANGHAISFDFSSACNAATSIRFAVIALCTLVGFLIVARSVSEA